MSFRSASGLKTQVFSWVMVALPVVIFYAVLIRWSFNLPLLDDVGPLLYVPHKLSDLPTISSKLQFFLSAQQNEYKLWLDDAVAYLQLKCIGHFNYRFLALLGDAIVLPIGYVVWRIFPRRNSSSGLLWFIPAAWLLFGLSFWETLNWPMASLQNLSVILFSFVIVLLLIQRGRGAFVFAMLSGVLAVAASANGFVGLAVGALLLLLRRRLVAFAIWLGMASALAWAYRYHYNVMGAQVAADHSVRATLLHLNPLYPFAVLGSLAGINFAVGLGVCCCVAVLYLLCTGYYRAHPANGYCTLFILLSVVGIAGIRSGLGIRLALSPRYRIYGVLLLILLWSAAADKLRNLRPRASYAVLAVVIVLSVLLTLKFDVIGYQLLHARKDYAEEGIRIYLASLKDGTTRGPFFWSADQPQSWRAPNAFARETYPAAVRGGLLLLPAR